MSMYGYYGGPGGYYGGYRRGYGGPPPPPGWGGYYSYGRSGYPQHGPRPRVSRQSREVRCDTCSLILNSDAQLEQHYSGKSHLKKVRAAALEKWKPKEQAEGKDSDSSEQPDKEEDAKENDAKEDDQNENGAQEEKTAAQPEEGSEDAKDNSDEGEPPEKRVCT